jgi:hypothetical protein
LISRAAGVYCPPGGVTDGSVTVAAAGSERVSSRIAEGGRCQDASSAERSEEYSEATHDDQR